MQVIHSPIHVGNPIIRTKMGPKIPHKGVDGEEDDASHLDHHLAPVPREPREDPHGDSRWVMYAPPVR